MFFVPLHLLSNIEITKHFNYKPSFNAVFSKGKLSRVKGRACVINVDDKQSKGTHRISLFIDRNTGEYFDSFGIEYILQEVLTKIKDKSITLKIFRKQDDDSVTCGIYCTALIEYIVSGKTYYTNLC